MEWLLMLVVVYLVIAGLTFIFALCDLYSSESFVAATVRGFGWPLWYALAATKEFKRLWRDYA